MTVFQCILLVFLVVCAVSVSFSKNLLNSVLIYMSFSLVMSIIWVTLESPDLAITEAAVGAGITSLLFFATLKKIRAIDTLNAQTRELPHEQSKPGGQEQTQPGGQLQAQQTVSSYEKSEADREECHE